ncbi:(Fe-S)-binding protein [Lutibacter sp.]|uniref:(Fe-S)-binding protein n=1 Tax=Lutibacter sp. TaxID=1925666 RepID=UPI002736B3F4|nr:(Fe-S)-binding protein [Lutibacter sp.]MDP3313983.1 (Fe-S)-binding protein [Lutibacter sp.]
MNYIDNVIFIFVLIVGIGFFVFNIKKIIRNIKLGTAIDRSNNASERWRNMAMVALGQSKMVKKPVAGILHIIVYAGFIIINIEVLEIIIDGVFGTHRAFRIFGGFYQFLIGSFEILAFLVLISVIVFWIRRMVLKIPRFWNKEMAGFPKNDALNILYFEMVLMSLFLIMNAADQSFQLANGGNPISQLVVPIFHTYSIETMYLIERSAWWLHIIGILIFLNYLYYSKHLHILLAFPNTYFANLNAKGKLNNLEAVTNEVKMMMDPNIDPFATNPDAVNDVPSKFGASDVQDLNWVQLMNAYTCTECGRCTSSCPANQTGKELSPRAIMMKTRDRLEEVGKNIDKNGKFITDDKQLLNDYITPEEIWACTSCNACVEECPVNIDPLSIIIDLRRYLVMEQSAAPQELNSMMTNIENNGAPWQYNQMDRLNWKEE